MGLSSVVLHRKVFTWRAVKIRRCKDQRELRQNNVTKIEWARLQPHLSSSERIGELSRNQNGVLYEQNTQGLEYQLRSKPC